MEKAVRDVLERAGVRIDGPNPWDIHVRDPRWYGRVWRERSLGLGESYMDGWWECERIDELVRRLLCAGVQTTPLLRAAAVLAYGYGRLRNLQSKARAHIIADRHYNIGNDLFFSFLDPEYKQYSCAYFDGTDRLEEAQVSKLALIRGKLELGKDDHLLDIGSGWGGLAKYAAERVGCRVTGVNISQEQLGYAETFCAGLPVTFVYQDYRAIDGRFDKIVSVGMFEHVGHRNYRAFMRTAHRCLTDDGIFLLHTIGANRSGTGGTDPWISKYIFPNSMLPSAAQIARAAECLFVIEDWHNLGPHYDKTLMAWHANFQQAWPRLAGKYDARFKRMWEYYLLVCAGAFRARNIQLWQVVMTKQGSGRRQPHCRGTVQAA